MTGFRQLSEDYDRVEQAIRFLERNAHRQPELAEVAAQVGLSEYHFQRLFTRWAGISPKRFLQFLTKENAKALLVRTSVLSAACEAGLSSAGRLHDLLVLTEAVTPGEVRSRGAGVAITYGFHPTPFGECLLAVTGRGICFLGFVDGERRALLEDLERDWPNAVLAESPARTAPLVEKIFTPRPGSTLTLHLNGTNFQLKVWEALLRLPAGSAATYQDLAVVLGEPAAARAVGNALGRNPVAFLIPCHRVIRKTGRFGNYRYGECRKKAILAQECLGGTG
ncbi:MAG: methylated-DNA--[protein]-cysteine S-methyltransferase [Chloroflexi bacterium]|nr:methylated-DNA--[protein]-cysteine S-methyltransferase [Chloroflexota bacterium]